MNQARDKVRRAESPLPYRELTKRRSRPSRLTLPLVTPRCFFVISRSEVRKRVRPACGAQKKAKSAVYYRLQRRYLRYGRRSQSIILQRYQQSQRYQHFRDCLGRADCLEHRRALAREGGGVLAAVSTADVIIGFAVEELRWTRFAPSPATKSGKCGFSPRSKLGLVSGHRRASASSGQRRQECCGTESGDEAIETHSPSCATLPTGSIGRVFLDRYRRPLTILAVPKAHKSGSVKAE